ncbi:MAG TPA: 1,4-alpha-glucan branching protein GlgB [Candidatus Acidoferrales bacterium]|nr:1,4-alpha-glucan branching protein GlgB [Candidatus Acidoferrales bacterium]
MSATHQPETADEIEQLVRAEHPDPFHVLGPHPLKSGGKSQTVVRTLQPRAESVTLVPGKDGARIPMSRIHPDGVFEAVLPHPGHYQFAVRYPSGAQQTIEDPYRFPPILSDFDLHLLGEGTHYQKYEKFGAHVCTVKGVRGVSFAVWAPNALRVSVVGDFNQWDGRMHPMRLRGASGFWELFIPGLAEGAIYKYELRSRLGPTPFLKSDPYGFYAEVRPNTASVVTSLDKHAWRDAKWMDARNERNWLATPISIYEVHLGSWRRKPGDEMLSYRELAAELIPYAKQLGYTHIELMPIMEHPYDGSWGYQTVGYYAATSRYGRPEDLMEFIDRCHEAGLGVFLDWTPAHFPRDAHGLAEFDGTHLYEHADPRKGTHPEWGTLVFNYGRHEVQNFLIANALFWLDKYHLDGLRVDAVASMLYLDYARHAGQWVANQYGGRENIEAIDFLRRLNEAVHERHKGALMIAEESTEWPLVTKPPYLGGLGFNLKWNMGWMNDILKYFRQDPIYRKFHHNQITFSMMYAFSENFLLPFSHDEVVHMKGSMIGKMPGDDWQKFANLRALYAYHCGHPGKKLLFMGGEFGQWREWDEKRSLDWDLVAHERHASLQRLVRDLNSLYQREPALHEVEYDWTGFEWMDCNDGDNSVLSFVRRAKDPADFLLCVCNFTPVVRHGHRVPAPAAGFYSEILNTDAEIYGGSNAGNMGGVEAVSEPYLGKACSLLLTLPPLAVIFFKPRRASSAAAQNPSHDEGSKTSDRRGRA